MPIHRIHFESGELLEPPEVMEDFLVRQVVDEQVRVTYLEPGEYDLTPSDSDSSMFEHNLLVHTDKTATYRLIPARESSHSVMFSAGTEDEVHRERKVGGRHIVIPEQTGLIAVGLPSSNFKILKIWDLIFYAPENLAQ